MYKVKTFNKIDTQGLNRLPENITVSDDDDYDAIILRSYKMSSAELTEQLCAVARAGAGYNNIPVADYAKSGVVCFNTPGANANAVKEITILAAFLSARKITAGIDWVQSLLGSDVNVEKEVEAQKSQYVGPELLGKKVGVLGLGAVGALAANAFVQLGCDVYGYDPFISVESAWHLSAEVKRTTSLDWIFANCDFVSVHIPLMDSTKGFVNMALIEQAEGIRLLNMARGELCDNEAILYGIKTGKIAAYVTDFPNNALLGNPNIITIPHLGASTPESETNCAIMAADQIADYLNNGNIVNSVNYPNCSMGIKTSKARITLNHLNIPNMVGQITAVLAADNINIANMINKSRGEYAYTMIDVDDEVTDKVASDIKSIEGILKMRVL